MRSYTVKTHADQEFSHDFNYVNVIDTSYEGPNDQIQILEVEVDGINEDRYQRELENDYAVISYTRNSDEPIAQAEDVPFMSLDELNEYLNEK